MEARTKKGDLSNDRRKQGKQRLGRGRSFVNSRSCRAVHDQSTATRRPRPQAVGARGAPHLPLRFSAKPSPSAPWARGLLPAFWERGSLDLPACGLRRVSSAGPVRPIFINTNSRPSRGAKPRGADDARSPHERPRQAGSQGGGEIKVGVPREVLVT